MKALNQCAKIAQKFITQHKTIIHFGLIVFLFKSLNVFNLPAATKSLITNYTFLINSFMLEVIGKCRAEQNQWIGFFMIETSVMKELNQHVFN